jgi:hypothetical protein
MTGCHLCGAGVGTVELVGLAERGHGGALRPLHACARCARRSRFAERPSDALGAFAAACRATTSHTNGGGKCNE